MTFEHLCPIYVERFFYLRIAFKLKEHLGITLNMEEFDWETIRSSIVKSLFKMMAF